MSTKKQVRRKRQEAKKKARGKINPAVAFLVFVVAALVTLAVVAYVVDTRPPAPRPGAVWSPEHNHWH